MKLPLDEGTPVARAVSLAERILDALDSPGSPNSNELTASLISAGATVRRLNDLGAFVEGGSVEQRDFFGHSHIRVLELTHLLEPYVLLVSTCRGSRWGLRLLRLKSGALQYHYASRIHRQLDVHVLGHLAIAPAPPDRLPDWLRELRLKRRLIPTREDSYPDEDWALARIEQEVGELLRKRGRTWPELEAASMALHAPHHVERAPREEDGSPGLGV